MAAPVPRDKLVGMQVVDTAGSVVGSVKDLAATVGEGKISLIVATSGGSETEVSWKDVQAVKDVVLLSRSIEPPPRVTEAPAVPVVQRPSRPMEMSCSRCGAKMSPQAKFCGRCGAKLGSS